MPDTPPPGCWSCGTVAPEEDVRVRSVIHPRSAAEGGPFSLYRCRECGLETLVVEVALGGTVLAPLEAAGAGLSPAEALLGGRGAVALRRRAREWVRRWGGALDRLREERRRSPRRSPPPPPRAAPPPPDRGGRKRKEPRRPPPPPPPSPPPAREPPAGLPRTREEARRVLGLGPEAGRREIDAAFRRASRRCHPDLVAHLDEEFQRLAHAKFLRLKKAHDLLTG